MRGARPDRNASLVLGIGHEVQIEGRATAHRRSPPSSAPINSTSGFVRHRKRSHTAACRAREGGHPVTCMFAVESQGLRLLDRPLTRAMTPSQHCGRACRRASRTGHRRGAAARGVGYGTEHATDRMDRHGPHGLSDGRAAPEGRLRRLDLEPHPLQGRAARQVRRQDRRQAFRSRRHGRGVLDRRRRQGRRGGLFRQGRRAVRQRRRRACSSIARPSRSTNPPRSASG